MAPVYWNTHFRAAGPLGPQVPGNGRAQGGGDGRLGTAEEVAASAVFLASNEAGYITGHTLNINGGMLML